VVRNSRTMLNKCGESGHSCLIPDFRENGFSFSPLYRFVIYRLYNVEVLSFYSYFS
jgi:hypothetical protein